MQMVKNCEYCGSEFRTELPFKIYCSGSCKDLGPLSKRRYGGLHYAVLKRDNFKCQECGCDNQLHVHHIDEDVTHNEMSNLTTLCQSCHKHLHHHGERNSHFKQVTKGQIEKAIEATSTLDEAAELLGITRKTLASKRQEYGMPQLSVGRSGKENKQYIDLKLHEIEMAYELEGTWIKAAERLGVSESFLRKRYKELKGLTSVRNRIYKDITKEQIEKAFEQCGSWKEVSQVLNVSKKTLLAKRKQFGLM